MTFKQFLAEQPDKKALLKKLEAELRRFDKKTWATYDTDTDGELQVRNWGNWVNPEDAEDEEDYDWQVMSDKSKKDLDTVLKKFEAENKCKVEVEGSEKNWLYFTIK